MQVYWNVLMYTWAVPLVLFVIALFVWVNRQAKKSEKKPDSPQASWETPTERDAW